MSDVSRPPTSGSRCVEAVVDAEPTGALDRASVGRDMVVTPVLSVVRAAASGKSRRVTVWTVALSGPAVFANQDWCRDQPTCGGSPEGVSRRTGVVGGVKSRGRRGRRR